MRCRYCGADNPEYEPRCMKCQRRMMLARPAEGSRPHPVIETAAAPEIELSREALERSPRARLETVAGNPDAPRRVPPSQPALFSHRVPRQVVALQPHDSPSRPTADSLAAEPRRSARRRTSQSQAAFEFTAPARPSQPFTRELDLSQSRLDVAPLALRALAAAFDAGVVIAMSALFLLVVRYWLGHLPLDLGTAIYFAPAPVFIAMGYKLLWTLSGRNTLGLQGARLRLVSFDGQAPTRAQRMVRLFAGWLSLASGAMGLLWAICDQESLTWHDHMSQTFLTVGPDH